MEFEMLYVSPQGNDDWSGKIAAPNPANTDGPFASMARARDVIRELKKEGTLQHPVQVLVRGGKYILDQTLIFGPEDSGTPEHQITYQAYPGERPILSGGVVVKNWLPYKGKILQASLPGVKGGQWKFRQLFYSRQPGELSQRMLRTRYPKLDAENPLYGGWAYMDGPATIGNQRAWDFPEGIGWHMSADMEGGVANAFRCKQGFFPRGWSKPWQGELCMFAGFGWGYEILPIKTVDEEKGIVVLKADLPHWDRSQWYVDHSFTKNLRFYIENMLEDLTAPGEWCLDSEEGILYFWPPEPEPGETSFPDAGEVLVPALDCLVDLRGASWVTISGLTLTETGDGDDYIRDDSHGTGAFYPRQGRRYCGEALHMKRASHCRIENNTFHAVGGNGIYLEGENFRNSITHNEIRLAGANGICVIGSLQRHPLFNEISDNEIHHCGKLQKLVAGVYLGASDGTVISHNFIHHMPHHAINLGSFGRGRNLVEYNEIRFTSLETQDNGAINSWGDIPIEEPQRDAERCGHVIRYNLIADTVGCHLDTATGTLTAPDPTFTNGIYLDDYTSNCLVYGNIVLRGGIGVMIHAGKNNLCENNIFIDCKYPIRYFDSVSERYANWQMQNFMSGNHFCRNIIYSTRPGDVLMHLGWRFSEKVIGQSDENLFWLGAGGSYLVEDPGHQRRLSLEDWQKMGYDRHSQVADPGFSNLDLEDFRLAGDSPALQLGFQPIQKERIGIRR